MKGLCIIGFVACIGCGSEFTPLEEHVAADSGADAPDDRADDSAQQADVVSTDSIVTDVRAADSSTDASMADSSSADSSCGVMYQHHVGMDALTWQDCQPFGTYDATEAMAACRVYAQSKACGGCHTGTCGQSSVVYYDASCGGNYVYWSYAGAATGHVSSATCPVSVDPGWG